MNLLEISASGAVFKGPDPLPANGPSVSAWFLIWCAGMIFLAAFRAGL